jgi:hypothetical protein
LAENSCILSYGPTLHTLLLYRIRLMSLTLTPASSHQGLQRVHNCAARLVPEKKLDNITPLLQSLHWLPINKRISYKLGFLCYKCLNDSAPVYLLLLPLALRSDALVLRVPRAKLVYADQRAFSYTGPFTWIPVPLQLGCQSPTFDTLNNRLKTRLFL